MLLLIQIAVYCVLYTVMVAALAHGNALNVLYFYPKPAQERAFELGLANREDVKKKRAVFLIVFPLFMLVSIVLMVGLWSGTGEFWQAYWRLLLILVAGNWYDGIVIDRLWVGHSKFWVIPGLEGIPFVKPWGFVLKSRTVSTLAYVVLAALPAGICALLF